MRVIEVDGMVHDETSQKERDEQRTIILKKLGLKEIRFTNTEVIQHTDQVIRRIETELG
ncbi:MAG: DUF559 domain-containing protein [Syntrophobacteraceae bacterium]|nr:DUF559 domain-containing protein [Syntrophobacteraceae bacterium]